MRQALHYADPSMASKQSSQEFQIRAISLRFVAGSNKLIVPAKNDISRKFSTKGTFQAETTEQYGRPDNVRVSDLIEVFAEDVNQNFGVAIAKEDICV